MASESRAQVDFRIARRKAFWLADFPGRTEADLYLWIMDHQHYLRERFGPSVQAELAAQHFADHYTSRSIKRVLHNVEDLVTGQDDEATSARTTVRTTRDKLRRRNG